MQMQLFVARFAQLSTADPIFVKTVTPSFVNRYAN